MHGPFVTCDHVLVVDMGGGGVAHAALVMVGIGGVASALDIV